MNEEKKQREDAVRERVLSLIDSEYGSDAAFEREMGLGAKTVNNWRRGRSASFMKMLPRLADALDCSISELLDMPISHTGGDLSDDEIELLSLFRRTSRLPVKQRAALKRTLAEVINLYLASVQSGKGKKTEG
jgi:transcriptional regulator with XRE-family HTH domain